MSKTVIERMSTRSRSYKHCELCEKKFKDVIMYELHKLSEHVTNIPVKVEVIPMKLEEVPIKVETIPKKTRRKLYRCKICKIIFERIDLLQVHLQTHAEIIHAENSTLQLNTTEDSFSIEPVNSTDMYKHRILMDNSLKSTENVVAESVETIMLKSGSNSLSCEICNKTFNQKAHLIAHSASHSMQKLFECDICGNRYKYRCNLQIHARVHTGIKLYQCNYCHKAFDYKTNWIQHERIHTGEKPYVCDVCSKGFTQKFSMMRHRSICSTVENKSHKYHNRLESEKLNSNKILSNETQKQNQKAYERRLNSDEFKDGDNQSVEVIEISQYEDQIDENLETEDSYENFEEDLIEEQCFENEITSENNLTEQNMEDRGLLHRFELPVKTEILFENKPKIEFKYDEDAQEESGEENNVNQEDEEVGLHRFKLPVKIEMLFPHQNMQLKQENKQLPKNEILEIKKELQFQNEKQIQLKHFQCQYCPKSFDYKTNWIQHERIHTGEKPYICDICSKGFTQKFSMTRHRNICAVGGAVKTQKFCQMNWENYEANVKKQLSDDDELNDIIEEENEKSQDVEYENNEQNLHSDIDENTEFQTSLQGENDTSEIKSEISEIVHPTRVETSYQYLSDHKYTNSKYITFIQIGEDRNINISSSSSLTHKDHQQISDEEIKNPSEIVNEIVIPYESSCLDYKKSPRKTKHIERESGSEIEVVDELIDRSTNIAAVACHECDLSFETKRQLREHKITHEKKNFKCSYCVKSFMRKHDMRIHERIHTNDDPYRCGYCEKTFDYKTNLVLHERIHTGEKPYKCNYCHKAFTQKATMLRHETIHFKYSQ